MQNLDSEEPSVPDFEVGSEFNMCDDDSSDLSIAPLITGMERLCLESEDSVICSEVQG